MGYDALNAGSSELRAGPGAQRRLGEPAAPTLISSNGRLAPVGARAALQAELARPYLIREVAGVRLGFVGVTSLDTPGTPRDPANAEPAIETLRAILPEVRPQADVIVALADLEPAAAEALAGAGLDLQVVLGARSVESQPLRRVGRAAVVAVGGSGRYVGRLTLQVDARGQIVSFEGAPRVLDSGIPDDPDVAALRRQYP